MQSVVSVLKSKSSVKRIDCTFNTGSSYKRVLFMFLEYTKKEMILRITEVLKSATAPFVENIFSTMGIAIAIIEKQKTPSPVMFT